MYSLPAFGRWKQKDQDFRVILLIRLFVNLTQARVFWEERRSLGKCLHQIDL